MTDPPARPRRPALSADLLASLADAVAGEPVSRADLASATAAAVVFAGRAAVTGANSHRFDGDSPDVDGADVDRPDVDRVNTDGMETGRAGTSDPRSSETADQFVTLADRVGLETMAELWRDAAPGSLPGSLWALYLLRTWCRDNAAEVARLWRAGRPYAPADEVVAGVADDADPDAVVALADAVLAGAYRGDFAVALERAAAFFRVVATGRRELAGSGPEHDEDRRRAERNERAADGLASAALRWREGDLV